MSENNKLNYTFIGMSGVGKTTYGKKIAQQFQYSFSDTDSIIEKENKISISEYIKINGEKAFLKNEESIICNTSFQAPHIISTGGSVIYSSKIMTYLKSFSTIVYLTDSIENIKKRIKEFSNRGVIMNNAKTIEAVFFEREKLYSKYADITIKIPNPFNIYKGVDLIANTLSK